MADLPRSLKFDDRFVYHLVRQISGGCEDEPILFPDDTTPIKFVVEMSQDEFTEILSALMTGADLSYPEKSHQVVWNFLRQVECPVSICEEILECLQPAFDEINTKLDNLSTTVEEIGEVIEENISQPPNPIVAGADTVLCGGATAVVDWMNTVNTQVYAEAEGGLWDNLMEVFAVLVAIFGEEYKSTIPAGALAGLIQLFFDNQVNDYNTDFVSARTEMIRRLYCAIDDNGGEFTFEVWGDWLEALDSAIPDNRAARIFAAYSPLRQSFLNQIAAQLNNDVSLQSYFETLYSAFEQGKINPQGICATAECLNCNLRYSYAEQHDFELEAGNSATLDPAGWYISGAFTGFSNPNWVIGRDMEISGSYTAIHVMTQDLQKNPVVYNTIIGYYDGGGVFHNYDVTSPEMTVIEHGSGRVEFILDLMTPTFMTGVFFNTNQFQSPVFYVTGMRICE